MATLDELVKRLAGHRPASALALGPTAAALAAPLAEACPPCRIEGLDETGDMGAEALLEALARGGRRELAVVGGELERLGPQAGGNVIARLRDVHAARLCVMVARERSGWAAPELLALALVRWGEVSVANREHEVWGYDIGTYKKTPDWLNPRHWAHPENWGKYRW